MEKENRVFHDLQRHLDTSPVGFPPTESGAEIRLLKHLFTPMEAEIATSLSTIMKIMTKKTGRWNTLKIKTKMLLGLRV